MALPFLFIKFREDGFMRKSISVRGLSLITAFALIFSLVIIIPDNSNIIKASA